MKDLRQAGLLLCSKAVMRTCRSGHGSFADGCAPAMAELHQWLRHYLAAQLALQVS
jgi:hypothetical protein